MDCWQTIILLLRCSVEVHYDCAYICVNNIWGILPPVSSLIDRITTLIMVLIIQLCKHSLIRYSRWMLRVSNSLKIFTINMKPYLETLIITLYYDFIAHTGPLRCFIKAMGHQNRIIMIAQLESFNL